MCKQDLIYLLCDGSKHYSQFDGTLLMYSVTYFDSIPHELSSAGDI